MIVGITAEITSRVHAGYGGIFATLLTTQFGNQPHNRLLSVSRDSCNGPTFRERWKSSGESNSLLGPNSHQFYSHSLSIAQTLDRLLGKQHVLIYEAIQQDIRHEATNTSQLSTEQYLIRIQRQMKAKTKWSVLTGSAASGYARTHSGVEKEAIMSSSNNASVYLPYLEHALSTTNQMVFITGGDNAGRSALLQQMQSLCPRDSVILLDGRIQRPPVQQSILDAVTDLLKRLTAGDAGAESKEHQSTVEGAMTNTPTTGGTTGSGGAMGALSTITSAATAVVAPASAAAAATSGSTAQQLYSALLSVGAKVLDRAVSHTVATEVTLFSQLQSMICNTIESEPHGQGLEKVLMALQDTSLSSKRGGTSSAGNVPDNVRHTHVAKDEAQTGLESPLSHITENISDSIDDSDDPGPLLRAIVFDHAQEYFLPSQFGYSTAPVTAVPALMTVTPSHNQLPYAVATSSAALTQPPSSAASPDAANPIPGSPTPSQSPAAPNNADVTTSDVLQVLLGVCKQKSRLSVIFSSSNSLFPYDIQSTSGYNLLPYLNTILVVTEMSPYDTIQFLQQEWSIGPHLARLLVEYFGGSLTQIENMLQVLFVLRHSDDWHIWYGFNAAYEDGLYTIAHELTLTDAARERIRGRGMEGEGQGGKSLLHEYQSILTELAISGFVAISRHHEIVRALLKTGLVLYVPSSALVPLIPNHIRNGKNGIIPVNQSVRIVIVKVLQEL